MKPGALIIGSYYASALNKRARQESRGGRPHPAERTPGGSGASSVVSVSDGGVACLEYLLAELRKHAKSNASLCGEPQDFAGQPNSLSAGKPYSRPMQPPSL